MATKVLNKIMKIIPRKHSVDSLQNTAVLGTSHIIRKELQSEAEVWAVGIAVGSSVAVTGRKCLRQETTIIT